MWQIHFSDEGFEYHLSWIPHPDETFNWPQARKYCRSLGMESISMEDAAKWKFVKDVFTSGEFAMTMVSAVTADVTSAKCCLQIRHSASSGPPGASATTAGAPATTPSGSGPPSSYKGRGRRSSRRTRSAGIAGGAPRDRSGNLNPTTGLHLKARKGPLADFPGSAGLDRV